ncbi:ComEA family DNA-binding protein [Paraburkholderia bannensis]|uniref:ComEA family DNA-binding protein n=1 Tax=Paraburkholderia bannensis TaxID=765414 RepID=UPI002ABE3418|nr:helix-hairpin-helix domain-containing protein [Paraburkholderia bannensis]
MLKKLLMLFLAIGFSLSAALAIAGVEVNSADETALESVKGIGPVHAKAIIDERTKNGPFKDADDLVNRVKGIGPKSVQNLEAAGLTINGSSAPPAGKPAAASKSSKSTAAAAPAATTGTAPNPATTTAQTPAPAATTAPQAASDAKASKSKGKSKKDAAASAAAAGSAASAPGAASDAKAKKTKKSKKSKAASDAAASGA